MSGARWRTDTECLGIVTAYAADMIERDPYVAEGSERRMRLYLLQDEAWTENLQREVDAILARRPQPTDQEA